MIAQPSRYVLAIENRHTSTGIANETPGRQGQCETPTTTATAKPFPGSPALLGLGPVARGATKRAGAARDAQIAEAARHKFGCHAGDDPDGCHRLQNFCTPCTNAA
jgi:hypothetical protein